MKIFVNFYGFDENKEDIRLGTLVYDGNTFTWANQAYKEIEELSNEPIFVNDELIDPKNDPQKFMKNLYKAYSGTYVRASKVKNA